MNTFSVRFLNFVSPKIFAEISLPAWVRIAIKTAEVRVNATSTFFFV